MADFTDITYLTSGFSIEAKSIALPTPSSNNTTFVMLSLSTESAPSGVITYYINRVYDTIAVKFVQWATPYADTAGTAYPGPGTFNVTTEDFAVVGTYTA